MLKKLFSIILILTTVLSCGVVLSGCSNKDDPIPIDYRLSTNELMEYKNKWVTFTGYLSLWSTSDLKTGYVLDVPVQKGPPIDEDAFIMGGIAINTQQTLLYTDMPIKVTGKLVFGNFQDENGLKYGCKVTNASVQIVSKSDLPKNLKSAERILENKHLDIITNALYVLEYYIFSEENEISEDELSVKIDFYDYNKIKKDLNNSLNDTEKSILTITENINILIDGVNKMIENNEFDKFISFEEEYKQITQEFDNIVYDLTIQPK